MPAYPMHACGTPGCSALVKRGKSRCPDHARRHEKDDAALRGTAHERGYDARWRAARERFLQSHPLCVVCERVGRVVPGRVVDHVVPHRGNQELFWDEGNWQTLCDFTSPFNCHGVKTMRETNERRK